MTTTDSPQPARAGAPGIAQPAPTQGRIDKHGRQRPPGPPARWLGLDLLRAMRRDYLGFTAALHRDHGDISYMRLGSEHAYDLHSPDLVREALVDHAADLIRWERGIEVFAQVFGQSVLVTEGDVWQRQRRMLMPAFAPRRVAGYVELMREAAAAALDGAVPAGQPDALVAMDELFSRLTMDVILRTMFDHPADAAETRTAAAATQTLGETAMREMFRPMTLPDWLPLPGKAAKRRALRNLRALVRGHIDRHRVPTRVDHARDNGDRPGLLAQLLALRDETTGERLKDTEVFDQCMISFQAGHDTSATALLWWSVLLAKHPRVAQRVGDEVDQVLAGRDPGPDDLAQLPWLTASLKEALRLYPPLSALMSRRTTADIRVGGWTIPRGAMLRISPWVLQRDPRWFDEPDVFRPERFLPDAPSPARGAWIPFGLGPRVCIGQHFAMMEMTLVGAMLLQRYRLEWPQGAGPLMPALNVTLRPVGGVSLRMVRRGP